MIQTPILVTIPICAADLGLAESMLRQLAHLGPVLNHAVLFVVDHALANTQFEPLLKLAQPIFPAGGELIHTAMDLPNNHYPFGHNFRFETAARYISNARHCPWLYLDPRCVPTRTGWLTQIEMEYLAHAHLKPVMGQLLTTADYGTDQNLISSTAVYPPTLPKRVMQRLVAQRGTDFEKACAELIVPIAHATNLIFVHAVDGSDDLPKVPQIACLVHTARAKDYAAALRGEPARAQPAEASIPALIAPSKVTAETKPVASRAGYYHSGDLGDIIYALSAIKAAGGGALYLGPRSKRTAPPDNPIRKPMFDMLAPLLAVQPYLREIEFADAYLGTDAAFDLNNYRSIYSDSALRSRKNLHNIAEMHCHLLNAPFDPTVSWLTVPAPITSGMFAVHRSPRRRDPEFPWKMICKTLSGKLLFVGLPSEHAAFERELGVRVAFWKCRDFLDLARVIRGSSGFIGNQSFPASIAFGLGVKVCQETWQAAPDCKFPRRGFLPSPFSDSQFKAWSSLP